MGDAINRKAKRIQHQILLQETLQLEMYIRDVLEASVFKFFSRV